MEIYYRRSGAVVEFCPKLEHLAKVIEQFRIVRKIAEIRHDRLFEAACTVMQDKVTLVEGDARRISFRFSLDGRRHHRGPKYVLSYKGNLFKPFDGEPPKDEYGFVLLPDEPHVEVAPIDSLTPEGLLGGLHLIAVHEVLTL